MKNKKAACSLILSIAMLFSMPVPGMTALKASASPGDIPGLSSEYYTFPSSDNTYSFQTLKAKGVDANVNSEDLTPTLKTMASQTEYVAVRWTGMLKAAVTGSTTFYYKGDNGIRLWVNGQLIVDHWVNDWDITLQSQSITLQAGVKYDFKLEYFQCTGGANLHLSWAAPGMAQQAIPDSCFSLNTSYAGPYITSMDTSGADLSYPGVSGSIGLQGNLPADAAVQLVDDRGASFSPAKTCQTTAADTGLTAALPEGMTSRAYMLLVTSGIYKIMSPKLFVGVENGGQPRAEYPRPDWQRDQWMNLNGRWSFDFDPNNIGETQSWQTAHDFGKHIIVPYPWESSLSEVDVPGYLGVGWYQRQFTLDDSWQGKRVILNFGAVDWRCKIWVNGTLAGSHEGGYSQFELDITSLVQLGTPNTLTLRVEDYDQNNPDPTQNDQLLGKQGYDVPCGYTHTSGIWQTVYLAARDSATYIKTAKADPDIDNSSVTFTFDIYNAGSAGDSYALQADFKGTLHDAPNGSSFGVVKTITLPQAGDNVFTVTYPIASQKLWDSETPNLYEGSFLLSGAAGQIDKVSTYFGQRKISSTALSGRDYQYINVNNKPVFLSGLLIQGFWQNGIYTAPTAAAYQDDIVKMKEYGFNMLRMHIKIEDPMFYYWADKTGMYIFQDMPWGNNFNADDSQPKIGRASYEYALRQEMDRDYNHPSIIAMMLFNETWGIHHSADTHSWMTDLFNKVKAAHPGLLVEDDSACNYDHIQPTDLYTFHMYPGNFTDAVNMMDTSDANTYPGSTYMFRTDDPSYHYDGEPWLNSEYGGVNVGSGDKDVSWCFKYQTTLMRLHQKLNGFVYTEPYDIEYECNGLLNYDRTAKDFGYDELAYGGDMSLKYLTQPNFIGFYNQPVQTLKPGETFTGKLGAVNWSGNQYSGLSIKWRFDATDAYGQEISTGISGSLPLTYTPYTTVNKSFSFTVPGSGKYQKLAGTVTAWIEDANGNVIAKNFTNLVVTDGSTTPSTVQLGSNSYALRDPAQAGTVNTASYTYTLPTGMDSSALNSLRVLAEVSSSKPGATQTAQSEQAPSDVTVSINGHEISTVTLPDDPRDMRGILSLSNSNASSGDYGYLLNLKLPAGLVGTLKNELAQNRTLTVTYTVKNTAQNQNGLKFYGETTGRYAVNPMVLLNPGDVTQSDLTNDPTNGTTQLASSIPSSSDYSLEADVTPGASQTGKAGLVARYSAGNGYVAYLSGDGSAVTLATLSGAVLKTAALVAPGGGARHLKISLLGKHIRVYANSNPVPLIDTYDGSYLSGQSGIYSTGTAASFAGLTQAPETYGLAPGGDGAAVAADTAALTLGNTSAVKADLSLPCVGDNGSSISWVSSNPVVVSDTGEVNRPASRAGDATVTLTATVSRNGVISQKAFTVVVKQQAGPLLARYTFDTDSGGTLKDSTGKWNGQYFSDASIASDAARDGTLSLNGGANSYAQLPNGILQGLNEMTVTAWVKCNSGSNWQRVFDFGSNTNSYMMLTVSKYGNVAVSLKNSPGGSEVEQQAVGSSIISPLGQWHHLAVTITDNTLSLYIDGELAAQNTNISIHPGDLENTTNNCLGRSQFAADPNLNGSIDDFRIYGTALNVREINKIMQNKPVTGISLSDTSLSLRQGSTSLLTVATAPADAGDWAVQWSSSDSSVAAVDASGCVKAITPGKAVITARSDDGEYTAACAVTVTAIPAIELDLASVTLADTQKARLTATLGGNATGKTVVWSSSNPAVAIVNESGNIFAVSAGSAIITATVSDGSGSAACAVTVNPLSASLSSSAGIVTGIKPGMSVGQLKQNLLASGAVPAGTDITVTAPDGSAVADSALVGTGMALMAGGSQYKAVVFGDMNGDGAVNSGDLLTLKRSLLGLQPLSGAQAAAADINRDGSAAPNASDLLMLKRSLLGIDGITQI